MAGEAPTSGQTHSVQFRAWRERDWKEGKPPERPSPYWFTLATDAIWMALSHAEKGLLLLEHIAKTLDAIAIPGPKPAPSEPTPLPAEPTVTISGFDPDP
jgi:hypothetical protein